MIFQPILDWLFGPHMFDVVAIACIGIGVAMALSSDPKDISAALWFFGAAAVLAVGRSAHWLVTDDSPPLPKPLLAALLFGCIGVLWIVAHTWAAGKIHPEVLKKAQQVTAHIAAQLVIETVKDNDVSIRFNLENLSDVEVSKLRVTYSSPNMENSEILPVLPRILPPHGRLSIPGYGPIFGLAKEHVLFLDLNYEVAPGGAAYQFTSQYRFIPSGGWGPQVVNPDEWAEHAGDLTGPQTMKDMATVFSGPQGTMVMSFPEYKPDGTINIVTGTSRYRAFLFDPQSKSVSFTSVSTTGKSATIRGRFGEPVNGLHIVIMAWGEDTVRLLVDGVTYTEQLK